MRVAVLFLQLCFLLLSGKHYYAVSQNSYGQSYTYLEKGQRFKSVKQGDFTNELSDAEVSVEEENSFGDDAPDGDFQKALLSDADFISRFYFLLACPSVVRDFQKGCRDFAPAYQYSCPKYIVQRDLRI